MATASATSIIVAQAFRYLKLAPISSFDDESDKAQDAASLYDVALRACLERADWSFASQLVELPQSTLTAPQIADDALPYSYQLPGDFVAMRNVGDGLARWRIDAGQLLRANIAGPLKMRYTALIDQEAKLPAAFRLAVAAQLASYMAPRHAESGTDIERIANEIEGQMRLALRADRVTASQQRYDGGEIEGWWADEVTR